VQRPKFLKIEAPVVALPYPISPGVTVAPGLTINNSHFPGGNVQNDSLKKLYVGELKDLFSAETQLVKALPKMAKAASSDELRAGFEKHLEQTRVQAQRLEEIFESLNENPKGKKCAAMEGLVKEGSEIMEEGFEGAVLDTALIGAARRVEHYEIAAYGSVCEIAKVLGQTRHASLLQETLAEETKTDEKLSGLAKEINSQAAEESSEEDASKKDRKNPKRAA
jgi:ferritin-like metal-binding protein YciE